MCFCVQLLPFSGCSSPSKLTGGSTSSNLRTAALISSRSAPPPPRLHPRHTAHGHDGVTLPESTSTQTPLEHNPPLPPPPPTPTLYIVGELCYSADAGRPTLSIHFFLQRQKSYARRLDWPLWAWDPGRIASLFDVFEGFLLILANGFDLCRNKIFTNPIVLTERLASVYA